jgi:hypothetical protein
VRGMKEPQTVITNNQFYGVKWDAQAIEAVTIVSKALLNLTELFKAQDVNIECLLKVGEAAKGKE